MKRFFVLFILLLPAIGFTQPYSIGWYKVAGGGGASTGGVFTVNGTIGQPDAGAAMTGGNYSSTGGFWSLSAVQMPGAPFLTITRSGSQAIIFWDPLTVGWTLQTSASLATPTWGDYPGNIVSNRVTNTLPNGNLFFRLRQP